MARKNRSPEENARREKIRELLQIANIFHCQTMPMMQLQTILYCPTIILSCTLVILHYMCIMEHRKLIKERMICRVE